MNAPRTTVIVLLTAALLATALPASADHAVPDSLRFKATFPWRVAPHPDAVEGIAPWNDLAGTDVFVIDNDDPQVVWGEAWRTDPPMNSARWPGRNGQVCLIGLLPRQTIYVAQHELGHCLGFQDHRVGDTPYVGVMSYSEWPVRGESAWWGAADRRMMSEWRLNELGRRRYGYQWSGR